MVERDRCRRDPSPARGSSRSAPPRSPPSRAAGSRARSGRRRRGVKPSMRRDQIGRDALRHQRIHLAQMTVVAVDARAVRAHRQARHALDAAADDEVLLAGHARPSARSSPPAGPSRRSGSASRRSRRSARPRRASPCARCRRPARRPPSRSPRPRPRRPSDRTRAAPTAPGAPAPAAPADGSATAHPLSFLPRPRGVRTASMIQASAMRRLLWGEVCAALKPAPEAIATRPRRDDATSRSDASSRSTLSTSSRDSCNAFRMVSPRLRHAVPLPTPINYTRAPPGARGQDRRDARRVGVARAAAAAAVVSRRSGFPSRRSSSSSSCVSGARLRRARRRLRAGVARAGTPSRERSWSASCRTASASLVIVSVGASGGFATLDARSARSTSGGARCSRPGLAVALAMTGQPLLRRLAERPRPGSVKVV